MNKLLEKARLSWWKRAYKIIWKNSLYKENITFSTKTQEERDSLVSFVSGNILSEGCKAVLDIGCGNGNLGEVVFRNCDMLIQADYSFNALTTARKRGSSPKRCMLQSDAGNLPFKDNTFDYIFMYSLLHNSGSMENARRWISSAIRLLKNEGRIYIGDLPLKKKLYRELRYRIKKVRSLDELKYFFAEFMQISFSIDDFLDFSEVVQLRVIPQPVYLKFHRWRVDIEIQKESK